MKTLDVYQMENVNGGDLECYLSIGGALVFGTGAIIFAACTGGIGALCFAMAGNWFGWGMTAAFAC